MGAKMPQQSSLKSQMFSCVCVYFGPPPHAGKAADPQLPIINPESIHLFSVRFVIQFPNFHPVDLYLK